jgi:hypothetical protein
LTAQRRSRGRLLVWCAVIVAACAREPSTVSDTSMPVDRAPQWELLTNAPPAGDSDRFEDAWFLSRTVGWIIARPALL